MGRALLAIFDMDIIILIYIYYLVAINNIASMLASFNNGVGDGVMKREVYIY